MADEDGGPQTIEEITDSVHAQAASAVDVN